MDELRGITFIDIESGESFHTGNDLELIMSEKKIGMPAPRISKVEMLDRDGDLDLSEVLRGRVSYKNRALSFTFICTHPQDIWWYVQMIFSNYIHGKRMMIVDPDRPMYAYIGRCELQEPTFIGEAIMFLTVTVDAEPYALYLTESTKQSSVSAGSTVTVYTSGTMPTVPKITVSDDMTIKFGDFSTALVGGSTYEIPEIMLEPGDNKIEILEGTGTITFKYQEGAI